MISKGAKTLQAITFDDIYKCKDKESAIRMLTSPYAEDEVSRLLEDYYQGKVEKFLYLNYDPNYIVDTFRKRKTQVAMDELKTLETYATDNKNNKLDDFQRMEEFTKQLTEVERMQQVQKDYHIKS